MFFAPDARKVSIEAVEYATRNHFEMVTPEMWLMALCRDDKFMYIVEECGGNPRQLKSDLEEYIVNNIEKTNPDEIEFSVLLQQLLQFVSQSVINSGGDTITNKHLVHGFWNLEGSYAKYFLQKQGLNEVDMLQEYALLEDDELDVLPFDNMDVNGELGDADDGIDAGDYAEHDYQDAFSISLYAPCLNDTLNDTNPLIGREDELERTIQILCRKDKNNPLHIGEPGVGKTAITYGLVERIRAKKIPEALEGAKVFALDLGGMLAGTQYRGEFEKRFKKVLKELSREDKPIVYIDEIHNIAGAGATEGGSMDAANMLKPYLADGHIRFIGATTFEEYKKHFEKNKSLVRRFQNVEIKEPSIEESVRILEGLKGKYEKFHGVKYAPKLMQYVVEASAKYINERFLPDKAIDLIDEAGSYRKLHPTDKKTQTVDKSVINEILTKICRVPIETVNTDSIDGLSTLEKRLKGRVFGQDEAIAQVVNAVKYSKAGLLEADKPLASLLFVGPTGVGKTEIARSLAEELGVSLIRFDMSEYGEKHAVAKLIGAPAGYVGYDEGGLLTEAIRKKPSAVLLLDEIEKAHADIYNILLQVMDYATLTDNQGRKADFRNVIIIMTSNAGANLVGKSGIGFQTESRDSSAILEAVKNTFQPEFRNRLNKVVVFNGMDDSMATKVVDKKVGELAKMLAARNISLIADEEAGLLVKKLGISAVYGAREVDRVIRNDIKPLFVDEILFGKLKKGGQLKLTAKEDKFVIRVTKK